MKNKLIIIITILTLVIVWGLVSVASSVLLSDQGTDVKNKSGSLLEIGNLTITIYDNATGGNLIFNQTSADAIANGSWNLMISPNLSYGTIYWKDYSINGEDLDFDGNERLSFQSSLGLINNVSFINFSLINSCPTGSSIRLIYANGSVSCETGSVSNASWNESLANTLYMNKTGYNSTQFEYSNGFFHIVESWLQDFIKTVGIAFGFNSTYNATYAGLIDNASYLSTYNATYAANIGNASWNETYAFTKFAPNTTAGIQYLINNTGIYTYNYNQTTGANSYTDTRIIIINNSLGNYVPNTTAGIQYLINSTGIYSQGGGNVSWNETLAHVLFDSTYNATYAGYAANVSRNWTLDAYNAWNTVWLSTFNATYANILNQNCPAGQVVNGTLANGTFICTTPTAVETEPAWNGNYSILTGLINNASYLSTYNATYASFAVNVSINHTLNTINYLINAYNTTWSSTYNATYAASMANNSWNETLAHTLFDSTYNATYASFAVNVSINHTLNTINYLINAYNTTWSSTYNATYAASIANNSWNETLAHTLFDSTYNASYASFAVNVSINHTLNTINYLINAYNTTWSSTYNATYAASIANNSWNETLAHTLFDSTYNASYATWAYNQTIPANTYTDTVNTSQSSWINSIFLKIADFFNLKADGKYLYNDSSTIYFNESKLNETIDARASGGLTSQQVNDSIRLEGVAVGFNQTYNATYAGLINNASYLSTYNATYASFAVNVSINHTLNTINYLINAYNTTWSSTYNATYAASIANNSWNETLAHTLFDSTYNASYATWAYNQTIPANTYTDTVNTSQSSWINSIFLKIADFFNLKADGKYLYNDSSTIYFNESKLNETIDARASGGLTSQQVNDSIRLEGVAVGFNQTYNATYAGLINNASYLSTYNATYASFAVNVSINHTLNTINYLINAYNTTWSSTYNATYAASIANNSWNETLAHVLFDSTYNATYAGYAANVSRNWTLDTYNAWNTVWLSTFNATYANILNQNCPAGQVVNGTLANGTFICTTPTAVETEPAWNGNYSILTGLINNASYLSTYNATYASFAVNVSINHTLNTINYLINAYNTTWSSTYNATYAASIANNSWNETLAHTLFDSTYNATYASFAVNVSINHTLNTINYLINAYNTTWSSTYNATYAASIANNSWNETLAHTLFDSTYNATYASFAVNVSINHTLNTINYLINAYNTTWSSTYNATYAASIANNSWNETLAHTLFDSTYNATYATWAYNQTIPANTYTDTVNTSQSSWINSIFLKIADFFNLKADGKYLYNDSSTIYFNESKLNETIDARASGGLTSQQVNDSIRLEGVAVGFNQTYNATYAGLINNASYLSTYNATYAGYADNVSRNWTLNANTYTDSRIIIVNNSLGNYAPNTTAGIQYLINSTGIYSQGAGNASWNETYAFTLYAPNTTAGIQSLINNTGIYTYNYNQTTPANEYTNSVNTTIASWINSIFLKIADFFNLKADDDYLYNDSTTIHLNESRLNNTIKLEGLKLGFNQTYNATYAGYADNVSRNWTLNTYNSWNNAWLSTYNASYLSFNSTANIGTLYNATALVYAQLTNTTANAQRLINDTNIQFGNISFTGGGYIKDNGTALILGHD